jgi:hypothetical protein
MVDTMRFITMPSILFSSSIFFVYFLHEELYVFLEFRKVCFIFVIENCSLFWNEDYIEREIFYIWEGDIVESPPPEVAIHTPTSYFR